MFSTRSGAAKLSIVAISLLILMKVVAGIITGSIGIRADAVHSTLDLVAVVITFIGIKVSAKPADERHPYGHGKAENISAVLVAGLIFIAAKALCRGNSGANPGRDLCNGSGNSHKLTYFLVCIKSVPPYRFHSSGSVSSAHAYRRAEFGRRLNRPDCGATNRAQHTRFYRGTGSSRDNHQISLWHTEEVVWRAA